MTRTNKILRTIALIIAIAVVLGVTYGGKVRAALQHEHSQQPAAIGERNVLYWYDAMNPQHHYDKPGKAPDGMGLVPNGAFLFVLICGSSNGQQKSRPRRFGERTGAEVHSELYAQHRHHGAHRCRARPPAPNAFSSTPASSTRSATWTTATPRRTGWSRSASAASPSPPPPPPATGRKRTKPRLQGFSPVSPPHQHHRHARPRGFHRRGRALDAGARRRGGASSARWRGSQPQSETVWRQATKYNVPAHRLRQQDGPDGGQLRERRLGHAQEAGRLCLPGRPADRQRG